MLYFELLLRFIEVLIFKLLECIQCTFTFAGFKLFSIRFCFNLLIWANAVILGYCEF